MQGRIKRYLAERGFGFISTEKGEELFFHVREANFLPETGIEVEYSVGSGRDGRPCAIRVSKLAARPRPAAPASVHGDRPTGQSSRLFLNPYNFVRLEEPPQDGQFTRQAAVSHAYYQPNLLTGELRCTLTATSPLFISSSQPISCTEEHPTYRFFEINGEPVIPASSLRGTLRSVFEAVTGSCMRELDDVRLSRRMTAGEARSLVPARVIEHAGQLRLALLRGKGRGLAAANIRRYPRPNRSGQLLPAVELGNRRCGDYCFAVLRPSAGRLPRWDVVSLHDSPEQARKAATDSFDASVEGGYLFVSGRNADNKQHERFFFGEPQIVAIPDHVRREYEQIIAEYKNRAGRQSAQVDRELEYSHFISGPNQLEHGVLLYAALNAANEVVALVPVQLSRRLYSDSIGELLLPPLHACQDYDQLCPACRLFGWTKPEVDQNEGAQAGRAAYAGRLAVSYGRASADARQDSGAHTLAELSSPKPTATFFYLRNKEGGPGFILSEHGYNAKKQLLRGRKFYRHHGEFQWLEGKKSKRNRTIQGAFLAGSEFTFTVRFENLAPEELGALIWSIELEPDMHHRLGFGKPLGLGSVQMSIRQLGVYQMEQRYRSLSEPGEQSEATGQYVDIFKQAMGRAAGHSFESIGRVLDLKAILSPHPRGLPVRYPMVEGSDGENFRWFMESQRREREYLKGRGARRGMALGPAHADAGLEPADSSRNRRS